MGKNQLWVGLYALPQPFLLIVIWYLLFNCEMFMVFDLRLDLRWALQFSLMLFSLVWPLYLAYKAAPLLNVRSFWLLFAAGLPLSLALVRICERLGVTSLVSFGGMNELLPAGQLVQTLWLLLLLCQGVIWISVKH